MIRRGGLQQAGLQPPPQRFLVLFRPERRAHDVSRGRVPVRVAVDGIIDKQVRRQHFAEYPLSFVARPGDRLQGINAGSMHDVQGHIHYLGNAYRPVGGLSLHFRRPGQRVAFRSGDALFEDFPLQVEDQFTIFSVHGTQGAQFAGAPERVYQDFVISHDRALIRHEVFKAVYPVIPGQCLHGFMH